MSVTRIICEGGCGFPIAFCQCEKTPLSPDQEAESLKNELGSICLCLYFDWRRDSSKIDRVEAIKKRLNELLEIQGDEIDHDAEEKYWYKRDEQG